MTIFVDCDWGKKNNDISDKYKVRGYPTVVFTDPEGKELERLTKRDPESVLAQIQGVAGKYPGTK
jgi:thioredoxin-related protein